MKMTTAKRGLQMCISFAVHTANIRPACLLRRFTQGKICSMKGGRKETRRELIAEFKKGSNLAHIREFQKSGGKRFLAPKQLTRQEESEVFPNLVGTALTGRSINLSNEFHNHVTLLLMIMRGTAQPMCDVYREVFSSNFKGAEVAKCIEINAVDSWFYGLFRSFIAISLRKQVSNFRQDNYMCYYGALQELSKKDLIGNFLVGHAFLIDRNGFVRWKACATPTEEELESMVECTKLLMP